jgi:thiol:disulfide interchange protein DsbG
MKKQLVAFSVMACVACLAHASPLAVLKSELAKNPQAGKVVKSFPAQGGLTGVVLEVPNGQKMIAYVTPDGRYLIAGAVIDLANGANLTAQAAAKEIGAEAFPNPEQNAQVMYALGRMQGITFGNPQSASYLAVVVDPTTPKGKAVLLETMQQAVNMKTQGLDQTQQIRFYIYGSTAPGLLAGSNVQQLHNLLTYVEGKPLPSPTASSKVFAQRNDQTVAALPVKAPLLVVFDPTSQFTRVLSLDKTPLAPGLVQSLDQLQRSLSSAR